MCERVPLPDGTSFIVCGMRSNRRYCACGRKAEILCDWKVEGKKSGTCDKPICAQHAKQVAPGKHLCPEHQRQWEEWKVKHPPKQQTLFQEKSA